MSYSVGELAGMTGVSVRTLHHYDAIGLLSPSGRSAAGYRRYSTADAARLHSILSYRALGFDLATIATMLDDPGADPLDHLRRQHELLLAERARLGRLARTIQRMMEARQMGIHLDPEEMREVFGDFDPTQYADEAEARWGGTDPYEQSKRRTATYRKDDWKRIQAEGEAIEAGFAEALARGLSPAGEEAMDLAEQHRQHISRWFYDCSYAMHRGLAEMYVADPRFAEHYERRAAGLSGFVRDAVLGNAVRGEA